MGNNVAGSQIWRPPGRPPEEDRSRERYVNASSDAAGPGIAARSLDHVPFLRRVTFTSSAIGARHILGGGVTHGHGWGYIRPAILKPGRSLDVYLRGLRHLTVFR